MRALLYAFTEHAVYFERHKAQAVAADAPQDRRSAGSFECGLSSWPTTSNSPVGSTIATSPVPLSPLPTGCSTSPAERCTRTRRFTSTRLSVPFAYDPDAPPPHKWLAFLDELWPQEPDAIDVLGEWFGYVVSGRLDLHKILLTVGPTRGGKGVIARVLSAMIGKRNVCGPTLNSLGGDFGLAPLIGKSLAVISDARFVGKNSNVVVERLLSISGEDTLTVNIKYREQWNGKLPCRLHVISNELPRLGDASTAVVGRIVLLPLSRSWLGKENHALEPELCAELPGILNWALAGLERLTFNNGNRFTRIRFCGGSGRGDARSGFAGRRVRSREMRGRRRQADRDRRAV